MLLDDPGEARAADLRHWRSQFPDAQPIDALRPRHPATVVGVIERMRLVPGKGLEISVSDGTGRLLAIFDGRASLGFELGRALRLQGTVAEAAGGLRLLNPAWEPVEEPYA